MLSQEDRRSAPQTAPRPLTELLTCPEPLEQKLGASSVRREYRPGEAIFLQGQVCEGLFLLLAGEFCRSTHRREKRLNLGILHSGDLVELSAVLGDETHNYSLLAVTNATALIFPSCVLKAAFEEYPPLRMHLLEELGREVSRSYGAVILRRKTRVHSKEAKV